MIHFTKDCNKMVVANEGEAGVMDDGTFFNPKGTVGIVTWADNDKSQVCESSAPYACHCAWTTVVRTRPWGPKQSHCYSGYATA